MARIDAYVYTIISYFKNESELTSSFLIRIKIIRCPHCSMIGCLILHGFLYGYNQTGRQDQIRGRRIYCSNRNNRSGCGKTISLFKATIIKGYSFLSITIWQFLKNLQRGLSPYRAFSSLDVSITPTTIYRIFQRFKERQSFFRTLLHTFMPPPPAPDTTCALLQTIKHFILAFDDQECPLAAFQYTFQTSLF